MARNRVKTATIDLKTGVWTDTESGDTFDRQWKWLNEVNATWKTENATAEAAALAENEVQNALPKYTTYDKVSGPVRVSECDLRYRARRGLPAEDQRQGLFMTE
jgi:hypothetical protein